MSAAARSSSPAPHRRLSHLLHGMAAVDPAADPMIDGLSIDSRRVAPGDLFLACAGARSHGGEFVDSAIRAGAVAVAVEPPLPAACEAPTRRVPVVAVTGLAHRLGEIAARFYGDPSGDLVVIGVTGTNGKTSCCHYLAQALSADGAPCGVLGTLGYGPYGDLMPGEHTTPDAVTVQQELARLRDAGARYAVMEVSSHGLEQGRVGGVRFAGALFTNLSHEHLDYHGDLASYGRAKQRLFTTPGLRHAVLNQDDAFARELAGALPESVEAVRYGLAGEGWESGGGRFVRGHILYMDAAGLELQIDSSWGGGTLRCELLGRFNASNLLAALAMLLALGMPLAEALARLGRTRPVPGRMERLAASERVPTVVVDYAHTPDALRHALEALRPHCAGRLWCVFGCGGERDPAKRPLMGAEAERGADRVVVTDDNPRGEPPTAIIDQILAGMRHPERAQTMPDRAAAIRSAISAAAPGDLVLVAGKGHEDYQIVGAERRSFSDRREALQALEETS